jgi:beta-galactosidase
MIQFQAGKFSYFFSKVIAASFALLATSLLSYAQHPGERKQLFDYNWKFFLGDTAAAKSKNFNDVHWRGLDLPHDWSIEGKLNPKNPTGGTMTYM